MVERRGNSRQGNILRGRGKTKIPMAFRKMIKAIMESKVSLRIEYDGSLNHWLSIFSAIIDFIALASASSSYSVEMAYAYPLGTQRVFYVMGDRINRPFLFDNPVLITPFSGRDAVDLFKSSGEMQLVRITHRIAYIPYRKSSDF